MRGLLEIASPAGEGGRLSVLVLHRVVPAPDPLFPEAMDIPRFDALCRWAGSLFNVLPLDAALRRLRERTLPARALSITFDDGYADNATVALPILQRHGMTAAFFIATGFLDGGRMWNDTVIEALRRADGSILDLRDLLACDSAHYAMASPMQRRAAIEAVIKKTKYVDPRQRAALVKAIAKRCGGPLPDDLMMTSGQVATMHRAGMQIGAHTVTHPILAGLPSTVAKKEMLDSKHHLETLLDARVGLFAYPNGKPGEDFTAETIAIAREIGFDGAVSTARAAAGRTTDPFLIPRFTPWDRTRLRFGARMLSTLWNSRTPRAARP